MWKFLQKLICSPNVRMSQDVCFGNWFSHGMDADGPPQDGMQFSGNVGLGP